MPILDRRRSCVPDQTLARWVGALPSWNHDRGLLVEEQEVDLNGNPGYRGVIGQEEGKIMQSSTLFSFLHHCQV